MNLAPYIKELIATNECIILPDFGGFETTYLSAEYDVKAQQMRPPSKRIRFRSDYISGGEVIEKYLVNKLGVDKKKAGNLLEGYISGLRKQLHKTKIAEIEGVGKFNEDSAGILHFTPCKEETNLAESFGLEPLDIDPQIEIAPLKIRPKKQIAKIRPRSNTLAFVVVGVLIICVLLTLTVFISSRFNLYLFNIGDTTANNEVIILGGEIEKDSTYISYESKLNNYTSVRTALQYTAPAGKNQVKTSNVYVLVAGSFKGYQNANDLQNKLIDNGFNSGIVEAGGYYRVSLGQFEDKSEALVELQRIRNQIDRSVWLLTMQSN